MELCIDFGGTEIKIAVIDRGAVVSAESAPVRGGIEDLATAREMAGRLISAAPAMPTAAGIAVPGVVDPISARMLHANAKYEVLREVDLRDWVAAEFGLPAAIENDARAALIGEASTGSAAGERDVVMVTLGTGIGTAAMIDGVPLRGRSGHAGILGGHVTVDIDGPVCPCGNVGCGEALASAWALREMAAVSMRELFERSAHIELRERILHVWGAVVVGLVHAYDPAILILSGGVMRAGAAVREPIESFARGHLWPSLAAPRFIVPPEPELSVVRGLSVLARDIHPNQEEQ